MTKKTFACTFLTAGAIGLLYPQAAAAQETCTQPKVDFGMICDDGNTGPRSQNTLAGCYEQGIAAYDAGSGTVATVYMSAKRQNGFDAPYQCNMSTFTIDAIQGPTMGVQDLLLTNNDGDRPCNHPILKDVDDSVAPNAFIFGYGSTDVNNNNVDLFAELRSTTGEKISNRVILSNPNGSNDGAGDCSAVAGEPNKIMCCYNQNGETTECSGFRIEASNGDYPYQLVKDFERREVLAPTNIDRDKLVPGPRPGTVVNTIAYGDQRPPEYGAVALVIDYDAADQGNDGDQEEYRTMSWVMQSDTDSRPRMYANSPEVTLGPVVDGTQYYYIMNTSTDGNGKNGNDKGQSNAYMHVGYFDANDQLVIESTLSGAGAWLTHSGLCAGNFGADGSLSAAVVSASITGTGPGSIKPYSFDPATKSLLAGPNIVTTSLGVDSGHLANIYGNNPNNQGRDFTNCIGGIPNPGFGVEGGYQPGVANFFFSTVGGMMDDDLNGKNAGWYSFVPGHTPGCELPSDPDLPNPGDEGGDDVGPNPDDDGDQGDDGSDTPEPQPNTGASTLGGCSVGSTSSGTASLILILGALFIGFRRRRS